MINNSLNHFIVLMSHQIIDELVHLKQKLSPDESVIAN